MVYWFSNDPLRKSSDHRSLTTPWEAVLCHPRGPEILVQIHMPWQVLLIPSVHAWLMHTCQTHDKGTKQTRKRQGWWWGDVLPIYSTHQGDSTYLRQISPCPWIWNSQTLSRSMSSSGKCSCIKKHTRTRILSWQLPPAVKVTHCNSVCGPPSFPVQLGTELSLQR